MKMPCTLVFCLFATAAAPAQDTPAAWDWTTASAESQGMSGKKLEAMRQALASRGTKALLVVWHDRIVLEWYAPDHSREKPHGTASLAKAVIGGVSMAAALSEGRLALDDKAARFIPQWRGDPRKALITLRQLASHTSGLADAESGGLAHDQLSGWQGDFWKRLSPPRDPFTLSRDVAPVEFEPGSGQHYSNPGFAMLAYVITAALRDAPQRDLRSLLRERVMRPIGVADNEWSCGYGQATTVEGLPLVATWGGANFTARALARVGRLMLHRGNWQGGQLLEAEAARLVTTDAGLPGHGGIGWWNNNAGQYPKVPKDAFWCSGAGHQVLLVVPSLDLIAVRNGGTLARTPGAPDQFHEPLRALLFEPLVEATAGAEQPAKVGERTRQP